MAKKSKLKPKLADSTKRISTPQTVPDPEILPPKFCLRGMRKGYSVEDCTRDEKSAFASRLYRLSQSTWKELRQMPRHGQGWEILPRNIITGDGVPDEITDDVELMAFRFCGMAPMIGHRSKDGVFNIIWLDRAFKLYPHG